MLRLRNTARSSTGAEAKLAMTVARAAPLIPMAGRPQLPKMRSQSRKMLRILEKMPDTSKTFVIVCAKPLFGKKEAIVPGNIKIDIAKITGITPAEFTLIGI